MWCRMFFENESKRRLLKGFCVVLVVSLYCLHMLRNLSEVYSVIPPIVALIFAFLFLFELKPYNFQGLTVLILFFFSYLLPIIYSFFWYPDENYITSIGRYFFLVPFLFFSIVAIDTPRLLVVSMKTYSFFVIAGAFSIFYQVEFGAVNWFAEASEREGLVRFSSLLGNLTAYGTFAAFSLPVIFHLYKGRAVRFVSLALVVLAMLMTLQKAAVVNLGVFIVLIFLFGSRSFKLKALFGGAFIIPAALVISYYSGSDYLVATIDNVLRLQDGSGNSDVSIYQSILDRLWFLPSVLYELHGLLGMLLGVGLVGGSGALGFPDYPMAHNGFFDLLFVGGVVNLVFFLLLFILVLTRIHRLLGISESGDNSLNSDLLSSCYYIFILFFVNFAFSGLLYLHPYGGVVFYSITTFICLRGDGVFSRKILRKENFS